MIRIQNIYYMLAYAYQNLNEGSYASLATEKFQYASDLFAAILAKGIASQIKRGLGREYISNSEALCSLHGKIDISTSLKRQTMLHGQLVCEFDNFSENTYMNQVLKTTAQLLIRTPEVSIKQKKSLRKVLFYFVNVGEIDPYSIQWSAIKYNRNNATYKMLINICYLVIEGMLMSKQEGTRKINQYVDDQRMHRLYEKFVLEFYRKHYPEFKASSAHVDWDVDDGCIEFLPMMKTDITLQHKGKTLIIDTKYYEHTMQTNSLYNSKTMHSNNMYQIFTYVKNRDTEKSGLISGVLLYAKTDEEILPNNDYLISGNKISVKTLDLNADFDVIKMQLVRLIESWI